MASKKVYRSPAKNPATTQARREWGKTYGAINASIGREIRAKRARGEL